MSLTFRPLMVEDAPRLLTWMREPHVLRWWTQDGSTPEDEVTEALGFIGSPDGQAFIIELQNAPIGYVQYYDPSYAFDGFYFNDQPKGSLGIDILIGIPDLTGQGLGSKALRQFGDALLAKGAPKLLIDPDPENLVAKRCYEKAGFVTYANHHSERWGSVTLMQRLK